MQPSLVQEPRESPASVDSADTSAFDQPASTGTMLRRLLMQREPGCRMQHFGAGAQGEPCRCRPCSFGAYDISSDGPIDCCKAQCALLRHIALPQAAAGSGTCCRAAQGCVPY